MRTRKDLLLDPSAERRLASVTSLTIAMLGAASRPVNVLLVHETCYVSYHNVSRGLDSEMI